MVDTQFKDIMKQAGLNLTPQRLAVYETLYSTTIHPSAESIYKKVRKRLPMVSLATIYKTLEIFVEKGLILEIGSHDSPRRFDGNNTPHPHLVCTGCYKIEDIKSIETDWIKEIEGCLKNVTDYEIINNLVTFHGYCPDCKKKRPSTEKM